jgi:protein-S-isoprenylcysteine O-methyltransferase Ste14
VTAEDVYRLMILGIMVLVFPIALYHRIRSFSGERLHRRDEGLVIMVGLRLCGLSAMLGLLTYLSNPDWMAWSAIRLPDWLRWLGLPLGLVAVAWLFWMLQTLGSNLTDTVNVRANATLVTGGPYRWVRHPMYLGVALLMLSVSLISANFFIGAAGAVIVSLLVLRTPTEEAKLVERFGEAYRQYASRTGRFLPRIGNR